VVAKKSEKGENHHYYLFWLDRDVSRQPEIASKYLKIIAKKTLNKVK